MVLACGDVGFLYTEWGDYSSGSSGVGANASFQLGGSGLFDSSFSDSGSYSATAPMMSTMSAASAGSYSMWSTSHANFNLESLGNITVTHTHIDINGDITVDSFATSAFGFTHGGTWSAGSSYGTFFVSLNGNSTTDPFVSTGFHITESSVPLNGGFMSSTTFFAGFTAFQSGGFSEPTSSGSHSGFSNAWVNGNSFVSGTFVPLTDSFAVNGNFHSN